MTQDEIIEMAKQVGYQHPDAVGQCEDFAYFDLEAFAKLVADKATKAEREACANLCWKNKDDNAFVNAYNGKRLDLLCADLIKARGESWE